ncbi:MAG: hypothetical protein MRY59_09960 [Aquisalinus sp.]|nr:hypothetical protein [Aquisalinus sp.]
MSAITTIIATAAATLGAAAAVRHVRKRIGKVEDVLRDARRKAEGKVDKDVLEFEKNPETGTYVAKDGQT